MLDRNRDRNIENRQVGSTVREREGGTNWEIHTHTHTHTHSAVPSRSLLSRVSDSESHGL